MHLLFAMREVRTFINLPYVVSCPFHTGGTTDIGYSCCFDPIYAKLTRRILSVYKIKSQSPKILDELASPGCEFHRTQGLAIN